MCLCFNLWLRVKNSDQLMFDVTHHRHSEHYAVNMLQTSLLYFEKKIPNTYPGSQKLYHSCERVGEEIQATVNPNRVL